MGQIYESITELIGNTPLLHLQGYEKGEQLEAKILGKLEFFNPNQSIKDRTAFSMISEAEKDGSLKPGDIIVESTSGNTGIGLAAIASVKGYRSRLYVQDTVSQERFKCMKALGAEVLSMSEIPEVKAALDANNQDYVAGYAAFYEKFAGKEDGIFIINQDGNPANRRIHELTTGPEIWRDTGGQVDIVVAAVGTGGTVSGVGKFLKEQKPNIKIIAVQPGPNSIPSEDNPEPEEIAGVHPFVGIPKEFVPLNLVHETYDECFPVETKDAKIAARKVAKEDGILIGTSSGAILHAATEIAKRQENKGKVIVAIFPDSGLRYLSTDLYE